MMNAKIMLEKIHGSPLEEILRSKMEEYEGQGQMVLRMALDLNISPGTLYKYLDEYGIETPGGPRSKAS